MASRALEHDIDRLYQLPLDEFTAARNALAKEAGAEGSRIKGLAKPPVPAWAVNQLYWRNGDVWNALIEAAENARRVHKALLSGRSADVRAATTVHDDAVDEALRATLSLLEKSGHPVSDATKHAIATTLRALPGKEPPGRLTRVLQPGGFEMLSGLSLGRGATVKPAKAAPPTRAAYSADKLPPGPKVDAKTLTRAREASAAATRTLREAEQAVRREQFEMVRMTREEERATKAVDDAREGISEAKSALERAEASARAAARAREAAAKRSEDAKAAVVKARARAESATADLKKIERGDGRARR